MDASQKLSSQDETTKVKEGKISTAGTKMMKMEVMEKMIKRKALKNNLTRSQSYWLRDEGKREENIKYITS